MAKKSNTPIVAEPQIVAAPKATGMSRKGSQSAEAALKAAAEAAAQAAAAPVAEVKKPTAKEVRAQEAAALLGTLEKNDPETAKLVKELLDKAPVKKAATKVTRDQWTPDDWVKAYTSGANVAASVAIGMEASEPPLAKLEMYVIPMDATLVKSDWASFMLIDHLGNKLIDAPLPYLDALQVMIDKSREAVKRNPALLVNDHKSKPKEAEVAVTATIPVVTNAKPAPNGKNAKSAPAKTEKRTPAEVKLPVKQPTAMPRK